KEKNVITNIANTVDVISAVSTTAVLVYLGKPLIFGTVEILCFMLVGLVFAYYLLSKNAKAAYHSFNLIMAIAYIPTYVKLWNSGKNSESFLAWGIYWGVAIVGLYTPIKEREWLAVAYVGRA